MKQAITILNIKMGFCDNDIKDLYNVWMPRLGCAAFISIAIGLVYLEIIFDHTPPQ